MVNHLMTFYTWDGRKALYKNMKIEIEVQQHFFYMFQNTIKAFWTK